MSDHLWAPLTVAPVPVPEDQPTLSVAAVARRLGVAPATLRTWDRRYGIGPRDHTTGRHRRYAPEDVARLELMQRALLRGVAPAEAASYALRSAPPDVEQAPHDRDLPDQEMSLVREIGLRSGTVVGLSRAAMAMDGVAAQRLVASGIAELGVLAVWQDVVRPVLAALDRRRAQSGECVEVEHLLRECALAAIVAATPLVTAPRNPRPVLLCCAPAERQSLPLYVLRAALAGAGIGTQMLGAALPAAALAAAVRRTAPAAVALWAELPHPADVFDQVPRTRQRVRLLACGPGWFPVDLPGRVDRLEDLRDAVSQVEVLVGPAR